MSVVKDNRLQIRVDPESKSLLEQAADSVHLSVSAFVLQAAAREAESLLAERDLIKLSPAGARAFEEALARPGTVNERLAEAMQRPVGFGWLD